MENNDSMWRPQKRDKPNGTEEDYYVLCIFLHYYNVVISLYILKYPPEGDPHLSYI